MWSMEMGTFRHAYQHFMFLRVCHLTLSKHFIHDAEYVGLRDIPHDRKIIEAYSVTTWSFVWLPCFHCQFELLRRDRRT